MKQLFELILSFTAAVIVVAVSCFCYVFLCGTVSAEGSGTTYYVSADGISEEGTDKDDPMPMSTAMQKAYKNGDTVLLRRSDTFYGTAVFNTAATAGTEVLVGAYGEGAMPVLSGAKIIDKEASWREEGGFYVTDLKDTAAFSGLSDTVSADACDVKFLKDNDGNFYDRKKLYEDLAVNEYDFYVKDGLLYFRCSENPYLHFGPLTAATGITGFKLSSNLRVEDIKVENCGNGFASSWRQNITLTRCVAEDIGGAADAHPDADPSFAQGNGINALDGTDGLTVQDCIFRNCYNSGLYIYTNGNDLKNISFKNNVLAGCSMTLRMRTFGTYNKVENISVNGNLSVNQGRGRGHFAREDKYREAEFSLNNIADAVGSVSIEGNTFFGSYRYIFIYENKNDWESEEEFRVRRDRVRDKLKSRFTFNNNKMYWSENMFLFRSSGANKDLYFLKTRFGWESDSVVKEIEEVHKYRNFVKTAFSSYDTVAVKNAFAEDAEPGGGDTEKPPVTDTPFDYNIIINSVSAVLGASAVLLTVSGAVVLARKRKKNGRGKV